MYTHHIDSLAELETFVQNLLPELRSFSEQAAHATVLAITGDLGAGKTTFVQLLAKALGVAEVVTSPTFTIMKGYEVSAASSFARLIHMDAYRIESFEETGPLRLREILETPKTLVCIEWAERIKDILPPEAWQLTFTAPAEGVRTVVVVPPQNGPRAGVSEKKYTEGHGGN
jgi:tRNA threonylcarbamoyladenosine biosynthesis protein TsaE